MHKHMHLSLYEDAFDNETHAEKHIVQIVIFRLSHEWYGITISHVKEVIKIDTITPLPTAPPHISGIVNIRGNILSVTDIKSLFDLPKEGVSAKSRLVIVQSNGLETGLWVDEVDEVLLIPTKDIEPTLTTLSSQKAKCLEGVCRIPNKIIGILNVEQLLTSGGKE